MNTAQDIIEEVISESNISTSDKLYWIHVSRKGLEYSSYSKLFSHDEPFTLSDWAKILNLSTRTLERYKKQKRKLDVPVSDRLLEVTQLLKRGNEVFGEWENFKEWMNVENFALGKNKPKDLLDTSFGIALVKDELIRIEDGILVS